MYNLGQYLPKKSVVHGCDPRLKIATAVALSILVLHLNLPGLGWCFMLVLGIAILGKITVPDLWAASRPVWFLFLILFLVYIFFTPGAPLVCIGGSHLCMTREGLDLGMLQVGRFWLLVLWAAILTMTTSPSELTAGLYRLLRPLMVVGISAHNIAMMVSLAVRFVPTLLLEVERMREAQESRGANYRTLRGKARAIKYMAIPLLYDIVRRSEELIEAMEARGYRPGPRTYLFTPVLTRNDYLCLGLIVILVFATWWWRALIII